ncbi:hypothetical protein [Thermomonospora cellulosilytica]|uniref:Uncharacterized protein n=1 Tax=Thermomonospora cellulosilytica TaxID=1411118 RepID=A0A7W3MXK6_9ACTN|nr:hypothetical protein [Thermomonospora cellulosilytica]MBA9003728.1 hypothetical protein [Thermomonospora cellulosilytica]
MTVRVFAQKDGATAEDHRLALSAFMGLGAAGVLDRRAGVFPSPGAAALTNVGPMTARVGTFMAWADGTSSSLQGGYPVVVDAPVDVTYDPGEAGVARVDRVVLEIRDNPYDASGFQDGRVRIVKGQASGAANPVPANSILLYETTVPAGASAGGGGFNITAASVAKFPYACAAGGILPVRDAADEATITPYEGMRIYRLDGQDPRLYRGGAWVWDAPPRACRKIADQTAPSTTLVNDNELFVSTPADTLCEITGELYYSADPAADFKVAWTGPSGSFIDYSIHAAAPSVAGTTGSVVLDRQDISKTPILGGAGTTVHMVARIDGMYYSGSGGQLRVRFAQANTHASPVTMRFGSHFVLHRV